jgi:NAD+ diphosphatase
MTAAWPLEGLPLLDRAAEQRAEIDLASADAVLVSTGEVALRDGALAIVSSSERPTTVASAFLGRVGGKAIVAVGVAPDDILPPGVVLTPVRRALSVLSSVATGAPDVELAMTAVAMVEWHSRHGRCARCGLETTPGQGGWVRRCGNGHEHYPRTDPAVIVAITDERDRLLLAHVAYHAPGRYSHLAGYVEPGESLEQAAQREVFEEASLRLSDLEYRGSQPWPFPGSIMVGYRARAVASDLSIDGVEVTEAAWLTREELVERLATQEMRLAPPGTIARRLIHEWYGEDLPDADGVGWA